LIAFERRLALYRGQNVQVLGISTDDASETAVWAKEVGITFPLLSDHEGRLSREFDLFDAKTKRSAKAVALVLDGKPVYKERVTSTGIPKKLSPCVETFL
jgi:peroxiredoxin